jgi:hypothetical protein
MHIPPVLVLAVLSFTGAAIAQSKLLPRYTARECDKRCSTRPREFGTVTNPGRNGKGDCNCWVCEEDKDFYTYPNGVKGCCEDKNTAWSFSEAAGAGYCCPKTFHYSLHEPSGEEACCPQEHEFFYDEEADEGSCCLKNALRFAGGKCVLPEDEKPEEPEEPDVPEIPDDEDPGSPGDGPGDKEVCGAKVCANNKDLGLEYGKCYRVFNANGQALHRPPHKWDYIFHTSPVPEQVSLHSHMYHFRVCRPDEDCSVTGQKVVRQDKFLLRDEIGLRDQPDNTRFITGTPGAHMRYPDNPNDPNQKPVPFKLVPTCVGKDCGFCLGSGDEKWPGLAEVCPADQRSIGLWHNKRYCIPVTVEQYPCLTDEFDNEQGFTGLSKQTPEAVPHGAAL